jgi:hypothetical protein
MRNTMYEGSIMLSNVTPIPKVVGKHGHQLASGCELNFTSSHAKCSLLQSTQI